MTKKMTVWCVAKWITTAHRRTRPNSCSSFFFVFPNHRCVNTCTSPDLMQCAIFLISLIRTTPWKVNDLRMCNRSNLAQHKNFYRSPKQSKRGASRSVSTAGVGVSNGIGVLGRALARHKGRFSTLSFTASARLLCDQTPYLRDIPVHCNRKVPTPYWLVTVLLD